MSAAAPAAALTPEWRRLELLGYCLSRSRDGQPLRTEEEGLLRRLQCEVEDLRADGGVWNDVLETPLTPLEYDVLACAVSPDVEPRLGWMYQNLQAGVPQPYPSRALFQDLFALTTEQAARLHEILAPGAPLVAGRLLRADQDDPYRPLRAERWIAQRILGREARIATPPGAICVRTEATWDDLILPPSRLRMLREFLLWIEHRDTVFGRWGGQGVGGPVALFAGPSGTGKTLSASVIANELGWPLFRVDIGMLVSKYVGETEENLNRLFDAAHDRPMVLQFDEADALFAKRGEVKEARDRYANMEVSHLLTRIETHQGPCILTTNLRRQMDPAFTRRFQVVVDFDRPEADSRARLWARLLPPRAPRDPQVDPELLGRSVGLTGGGIRNAALHAAFLAAGEEAPIGLRHVSLAVWRELTKEGREVGRHELGPLAASLPQEVERD